MSEQLHFTPGPWTVRRLVSNYAAYAIKEAHERLKAAEARGEHWQDESDANAHLIAAAPDLYEACNLLRRFTSKRDGTPLSHGDIIMTFVEDGSTITEVVAKARAALAKAEGCQ